MKAPTGRFGPAVASGFTLLELVIAMLVLSIMITLLFNGLRLGARTWDSVEERTRVSHEWHLAQLFLRRQLEQAQLVASMTEQAERRRASFVGERHAVRFVSPLPAHLGKGGMYWFAIAVTEGSKGKQLIVSYELFQTEQWERYKPAEPEKVVLIDGLGDAEFAYLGGTGPKATPMWVPRWVHDDRLPPLVRLRLKSKDAGTKGWQELLIAPKSATH